MALRILHKSRGDFSSRGCSSERVAIGLAVEAELSNRRGSNQYQVKGELPVNSPEAAGKETREIAAQKAGFGSEFTYRQAKTVVQNASPELVEAMDNGRGTSG